MKTMYEMAVENFDIAAEYLKLDDGMAKKLKSPQRCLIVSVPVRMDDGRIEVFKGYRVQHVPTRGARVRAQNRPLRWQHGARNRGPGRHTRTADHGK